MEEKRYSITLSDGVVLENLKKNGDNYISTVDISKEVFSGNCTPVVISNGETEERHEYMELVQVTSVGDETWFVLRDLTEDEIDRNRLWAGLEYLSMMTEIEL